MCPLLRKTKITFVNKGSLNLLEGLVGLVRVLTTIAEQEILELTSSQLPSEGEISQG